MSELNTDRILSVELDEARILRRTPEIDHERQVALTDLTHTSQLRLNDSLKNAAKGPYHLFLSVEGERLLLRFTGKDGMANDVTLSLKPLRGTIKDYFLMCEHYYEAIRHAPADRIQTLDMARRSVHNEAAETLQSLLSSSLTTDFPTARRLFTLICVLHIK